MPKFMRLRINYEMYYISTLNSSSQAPLERLHLTNKLFPFTSEKLDGKRKRRKSRKGFSKKMDTFLFLGIGPIRKT